MMIRDEEKAFFFHLFFKFLLKFFYRFYNFKMNQISLGKSALFNDLKNQQLNKGNM